MWMFSLFSSGYYSIILWPFHIPLWCAGYLIRDKIKSSKTRIVWLCILAAGLVFCDRLCEWVLTGYDRLGSYIAMLIIWDLLFGYFANSAFHLLRKLFRALINWIYSEEEISQSE